MESYDIAVLPGDGIGPEIMDAALRVLDLVGREFNVQFNYKEGWPRDHESDCGNAMPRRCTDKGTQVGSAVHLHGHKHRQFITI